MFGLLGKRQKSDRLRRLQWDRQTDMKKTIIYLIASVFFLIAPTALKAEPLDRIAKKISAVSAKVKKHKIAVVPFQNFDGTENKGCVLIAERLTTRLTQGKRFQVVERKLLEKVLRELQLQQTGVVEEASAHKLGRILGVDAIVTGTLVPLKDGQVEVNARLIQTETAAVLAAAGEQIRPDWETATSESVTQGSADMSKFYNSRDYKALEKSDKPSAETAAPASIGNAVLITNIQGMSVGGLKGGEILDRPKAVIKDLKIPQKPLDEITQTWEETLGRSDYAQASLQFARLRDRYSEYGVSDAMDLSRIYLSEGLLGQGKQREAIREAIPVAKHSRRSRLKALALFLVAWASEESGRPTAAMELYREIIREYPFEANLIRAAGIRLIIVYSR